MDLNWLIGGDGESSAGRTGGNDRLVGRGGDDVLDGFDGAVGSEYSDSFEGGEGNDICTVDPDDGLISCEKAEIAKEAAKPKYFSRTVRGEAVPDQFRKPLATKE